MFRANEDDALAPARATLLVARVAMHLARTQIERVVLLPSESAISFDEAIHRLSKMEKPVRCVASVENGTLGLECAPFNPPATVPVRGDSGTATVSYESFLEDQLREQLQPIHGMRDTFHREPHISLKSGDEALDLTASGYETWLRDYLIMASFMLRMEHPLVGDEHSEVPRAVVTVSPVDHRDGFRKATEIFQGVRGPFPPRQ